MCICYRADKLVGMPVDTSQSAVPPRGIAGIGVDTVDIERFEAQLERAPKLRGRLFTEAESLIPPRSLAARFAGKEALIKALGGSDGVNWHDIEILRNRGEAPSFTVTPELSALLERRGLAWPHLSLTHDGGVATAFVVVEYEMKESQ